MQDEIAASNTWGATATEPPSQPKSMSELVSSYDWASSPLGSDATWPDSLKAAVRIMLTSGFPMWMAWGPELTFLYNDAYARTTLSKKHPGALGLPATEVWPEIWDVPHLLLQPTCRAGWTDSRDVVRGDGRYRARDWRAAIIGSQHPGRGSGRRHFRAGCFFGDREGR